MPAPLPSTETVARAIDPSLAIASVELGVGDLGRAVDFYERVLGLTLIERDARTARLGALAGADGGRAALVLHRIEHPTPAPAHASGLYHVAWLHPTRAALADTVQRIAVGGWRFDGAADHGVSEALYLSDPDGLGVEIYVDRPRERWERPAGGRGVSMQTLALDLEDLLAQGAPQPSEGIAAGAGIGHIHLKVADVPASLAFYRDALGMQEQARLPSAAFVSAGGYHHHVGLNSWESRGGSPAPDAAPGLRAVDFTLGDAHALQALERGLPESASAGAFAAGEAETISVRDPDGQLLRFAVSR